MINIIVFIGGGIGMLFLFFDLRGFYINHMVFRLLVFFPNNRNNIIFLTLLCSIILISNGVSNDILRLLQEQVVRSNVGHVVISQKARLENGTKYPNKIIKSNEIIKLIKSDTYLLDNIDFISERMEFAGVIINLSNQLAVNFSGMGISPESSIKIGAFDVTVSGSELSNVDISAITVDKRIADRINVGYGDLVKLIITNDKNEKVEFITHIRGVFNSEMNSREYGIVKLPLETAGKLLETNAASMINIMVTDSENISSVISRIEIISESSKLDLTINSWVENNPDIKSIIYFFHYYLFFLKSIVVIFTFFIINRMITNSVDFSLRDISILNKLGMWRSSFGLIFLLEAMLYIFIISFFSIIIAIVISWLINLSAISIPLSTGGNYQLYILWSDEYSSVRTIPLLLSISSIIASSYPIMKAINSQRSL